MSEALEGPYDPRRDDRKSAAIAARLARAPADAVKLDRFEDLRRLFRSADAVQGMSGADAFGSGENPDHMPVFFPGDGPHRCPGAQLALHETRLFLDRMLRLPGIRLARAPRLAWNEAIMGYELREAIVACDKAQP
jgi:cytochrome P450